MGKRRWYITPDDLTPEERMDRIVELLAEAVCKLTFDQMNGRQLKSKKVDESISGETPDLIPGKSGPVPYGLEKTGSDRIKDDSESKWVDRILKLSRLGLSSEKIAKRLNAEDKESRRAGKWCRSTVWRILKREGL